MIASSWVPQTTGGSLKRYRFAVCFVAAFSCVNLFSSCSWIIGIQFDINENFENPTSSNLTTFASKLPNENRRYAYIGKNESDRVSMEQRNASALQSQRKNREIEFIGKTSEIKLARESGENVWDSAILATTKILYRNSHSDVLQFWLSQPPPKVYIYPTIPSNFSDVETISHCIDQKFLGPNVSEIWVQKKKNCRWRPEICQDHTTPAKPKHQMFLAYRYNYNIDVAYLDKFHRYPHQTSDPSDADLFVVPYPHKSHCLCNKNFRHYSARCAVSFDEIQSNVLSNLEFMQEPAKSSIPYSPERHVFFHGADWLQELKHFRAATSNSISISLGPVSPCEHSEEKPCGHVTVPYLSTDRDFQPHVFFERVWSSSSKRPYFLAAALSSPRGLPLRGEFLKHWKKWIGKSINNKPHQIINMGISRGGKKPMSREFIELYRNSTVCLIVSANLHPFFIVHVSHHFPLSVASSCRVTGALKSDSSMPCWRDAYHWYRCFHQTRRVRLSPSTMPMAALVG